MIKNLYKDTLGYYMRTGGTSIEVNLLPNSKAKDTAVWRDRTTIKQKKPQENNDDITSNT